MEEKDLNQGEEKILNSKDVDTESDKTVDTKVYTSEEVNAIKKEMQSNSEKGVQKIIAEKKLLDSVIKSTGKVAEDSTYLVTLYNENPEVAKIILENYYEGQSIDEYKTDIDYIVDYEDPKVIERIADEKVKKIIETKLLNNKEAEFIKKLDIKGSELEEFKDAFNERKELKSFKLDNIDKQLEKAYREVSNNLELLKSLKTKEVIAKTMTTNEQKSGGDNKRPKTNQYADFLKKHNIL